MLRPLCVCLYVLVFLLTLFVLQRRWNLSDKRCARHETGSKPRGSFCPSETPAFCVADRGLA